MSRLSPTPTPLPSPSLLPTLNIPRLCDFTCERNVLDVLYRSTSGPSWVNNANWLDPDSPHCTWHGIGCDEDGYVDDISLIGMGLSGYTPSELWTLSRLRRFSVRDNLGLVVRFEHDGVVPFDLAYVDVSGTATVDAFHIEDFPSISYLDMSLTNVTAIALVFHVFRLASLEVIRLANTTAAYSLGRITSGPIMGLRELHLQNSAVSGTIPNDIGRFTELVALDLSNTKLIGTIPNYSIDDLLQLESFDVHSCHLSGIVPDFADHARLRHLDLSDNYLSGTIPSGFLRSADLWSWITIDLSDNLLEGALIDDLARFARLEIDVTGNMIFAVDDEICDRLEWNGGVVRMFGCDAVLCPPGTHNVFGRQVSAEYPCLPCDDAPYFGSTACPYDGKEIWLSPTPMPLPLPTPLPTLNISPLCDFTCERTALEVLYRSTGGSDWRDSANWLDPDSPHCTWHGIGCDEDGFVQSMDLANNNLSGFTPPELWRLSRLVRITVRDNVELEVRFRHALGGNIAPSPWLEYVDASGTLAVDAYQIEEFPLVHHLDVSHTSISDTSLVKHVFTLTTLKSLDVSNTTAEYSFSRLTASPLVGLQELRMASSGITGTIPNNIDKFTELVTLDLSKTELVGTLPFYSIEKLLKLRSFDVHSCMLGGGVPEFVNNANLHNISLQDNYFSGMVPPNFLAKADVQRRITIDLSDNSLQGTLINDLARFERLDIDVTGNMISAVDDEICDRGEWNGGVVEMFGCDALLCEPGTYNEFGRQVSAEHPCLSCDDAPYFGSTACPYHGSKPWPSEPLPLPSEPTPSDLRCDLACMNGGICVLDMGSRMLCLCPEGFSGYQCELANVQCNNGLTCLHGGICSENDLDDIPAEETLPTPTFEDVNEPARDETHYCDCSRAFVRRMPTAGLQCEHVATVICQPEIYDGEITSFCTNGGECLSLVEGGKPHAGCNCPDGFSGAFCEYVQYVNVGGETVAPKPVESDDNDAPGYGAQPTILCPDGHWCNNGGICEESLDDKGSYYCNCDGAIIEGLPSAGIHCEQIGTALCSQTWILGQPTPFCANEGHCLGIVDSHEDRHPGCKCPPLWEGDKCQFAVGGELPPRPVQEEVEIEQEGLTCPDGSTCLNNGMCTPDPNAAGSYYCYCSFSAISAIAIIPHAGIRCEYKATSICTVGNPHASFCTNGGSCLKIVEPGQVHQGCQCPAGFEGAFCQFDVGTAGPDSLRDNTANAVSNSGGTTDEQGGDGLEPGQIALLVCLPALVLIAVLTSLLVWKRGRSSGPRSNNGNGLQRDEASTAIVSPIAAVKDEEQSSTSDSNQIEEGLAIDEGADDVKVHLSFEKVNNAQEEEEKEEVEAVAVETNYPVQDSKEAEAEAEAENDEVGGGSTDSSGKVLEDEESTSS